jgi:hypothetical protein
LDDRYARLVHDALEALDPYRIHRHTRPDQVTRWDGAELLRTCARRWSRWHRTVQIVETL